jgi:transposase
MTMMVVLGIDAHKWTHTIVAADPSGAAVAQITVRATTSGHLKAVQWAARFTQRRWAMEDCRHVSRRFEAELLAAGETVMRVPPKMMTRARDRARTRGKSDPIDALATARAALAEPALPQARLEGTEREVKLLVDYRETLVRERTATQNRLRWRLHELEPGWDPPAAALDRYHTLDGIEEQLNECHGLVAALAGRETLRIRQLTVEINQLQRDIAAKVAQVAPSLLQLVGCGALSAGKLVGEAAGVERFTSRDAYAKWTGTAPIPVWSGRSDRHRVNRGGNRQTNAALHRIAITQARMHPPAQQLITKHLNRGKTKQEALRILKRRLANVVYRLMLEDTQQQALPKAA